MMNGSTHRTTLLAWTAVLAGLLMPAAASARPHGRDGKGRSRVELGQPPAARRAVSPGIGGRHSVGWVARAFAPVPRLGKMVDLRGARLSWSRANMVLVSRDVERLQGALKQRRGGKRDTLALIEGKTPWHLAAMQKLFDKKYGPTWKGASLRGALNRKLSGDPLRAALKRLDGARSAALATSPGGDEGRIKANILKVFELARQRGGR